MPIFDMPLEELVEYRPDVQEPVDFDVFWQETIQQATEQANPTTFGMVDYGLKFVDSYDVTFSGYGGQPVKGWLLLPKDQTEPAPIVIQYIGYGGGRGIPYEWLPWVNAGYATFVMDTRGQGSGWRKGDTADIPEGANPSFPGFMTQGILNPSHYYYRRVFTDAVRAVQIMQGHEMVDSGKIILTGGSQGGGITIAVAGILGDEIALAMPEVPFLCDFPRAVRITPNRPYTEISDFLKVHRSEIETVFHTLSYFDGVNFARRITAESLFSVGMMDMTCPPSTVYAAYNHIDAPKEMSIYHFNDHEGGEMDHFMVQLEFVKQFLEK